MEYLRSSTRHHHIYTFRRCLICSFPSSIHARLLPLPASTTSSAMYISLRPLTTLHFVSPFPYLPVSAATANEEHVVVADRI